MKGFGADLVQWRALMLFLMGILSVPLTVQGSEGQSLELLLRIDSEGVSLLEQRIVPVPAPRQGDKGLKGGDLLLECKNAVGKTISQTSVPDPRWMFVDGMEGSTFVGEQVKLKSAVMMIRVPVDERLDRISLKEPHLAPDGKIEGFKEIGSCPIKRPP